MRPRGWHLPEKHLLVDGEPAPGALVDFGFYFFHNAHDLTDHGSGPYFSLPKLESHREAHLWTSVFEFAENHLGLRQYSIKATALIETIPGAFEIDEIMYVLKDYLVGLECGPTDYLFSFIKTMRAHPEYLVPDRHRIGMTEHLLRAYSQLAIRSAHRRGVLVIGGAASQLPIARDAQADAAALAAIREEKAREIADGHDGTWVAHLALVPVVLEEYARGMKGRNQLGRLRRDVRVRASDLLETPVGPTTEIGLRANVSVALRYLSAWLAGEGRAPALGRMQDAAGAEVARTQIWQWVHHSALLEDGRRVSMPLMKACCATSWPRSAAKSGWDLAAGLMRTRARSGSDSRATPTAPSSSRSRCIRSFPERGVSMRYDKITVPAAGERITLNEDYSLNVPDHPVIPFVEGDGIGVDVTPVMLKVVNAAVSRAYGHERAIEWMEIYAGEKAVRNYGADVYMPDESLHAMRDFVVSIKGPLGTPVGGGIRSLNVAIRQTLDLYACVRPIRYFPGVESPMADSGLTEMVVFRENTEDIYAGIEWPAGSAEVMKLIDFLQREMSVRKIRLPASSGIGIKPVSREGSERLVRKALQYAVQNDRVSVTLVHKGNIMKYTEGAFRNWGYEVAREEFAAQPIDGGPWLRFRNPRTGNDIVVKDVIADNFLHDPPAPRSTTSSRR